MAPGKGATWATGFALLFLSLSLLAMALVPMWLENETEAARTRIEMVLEPAERLATAIQLAQARQMEAFHSFLLSNDPASRVRYREAREEEQAAVDTLDALTRRMADPGQEDSYIPAEQELYIQVQEALGSLRLHSVSWHMGHQDMLSQEVSVGGPPQGLTASPSRERMAAERSAYEAVITAGQDLQEALAVVAEASELSMSRARFRQTQYTQILAVLGLLATAVVLILARRLRSLMQESEQRRREASRARREADGLLRATGDGVLGVDLQGRCTFLNRAGTELLGYSSRAVVGRDLHELLHHSLPDGRPLPREECPIMTALSSGETLSGRNETLWRAGREPFPVQLSLRAVMDGPDPRGAVLTFTDMTETRAAEASLREALQARDEVLGVVSHDLRNPVGTIFSAASLLLTLDPPPEKRREHLEAVKRSAERMNRLIQDLLDIGRMEAGVLTVHPAPFQAEPVLEEVAAGYRDRAADRGISLVLSAPPDIPTAWGDRYRVIQVLTNLLDNAVRETRREGEITLGVRDSESQTGLDFFVSDTGPGIRLEDQARLFDRFWQVSRKDKGGAGLGLSIVKGIVDAHGGKVWVESRMGEGTTVWIFLPGEPVAGSSAVS